MFSINDIKSKTKVIWSEVYGMLIDNSMSKLVYKNPFRIMHKYQVSVCTDIINYNKH